MSNQYRKQAKGQVFYCVSHFKLKSSASSIHASSKATQTGTAIENTSWAGAAGPSLIRYAWSNYSKINVDAALGQFNTITTEDEPGHGLALPGSSKSLE